MIWKVFGLQKTVYQKNNAAIGEAYGYTLAKDGGCKNMQGIGLQARGSMLRKESRGQWLEDWANIYGYYRQPSLLHPPNLP